MFISSLRLRLTLQIPVMLLNITENVACMLLQAEEVKKMRQTVRIRQQFDHLPNLFLMLNGRCNSTVTHSQVFSNEMASVQVKLKGKSNSFSKSQLSEKSICL